MEYTIQAIPQDEQGVAFHLACYKPFRLRALKTDPSAFSSTYEREITYDDEKWRSRVMNPLVTTLVAVAMPPPERNMDYPGGEVVPILSATTVVGPLPPSDPLAQHLNSTRMQTDTSTDATGTPRLQTWAINAVWTAPEARRKGIAARLMREAIRHVQEQARARAGRHSQGNVSSATTSTTSQEGGEPAAAAPELYLDVGVEKNNEAAIALYEKSGYVPYSEECEDAVQGESTQRKEFINMYLPVEYLSELKPKSIRGSSKSGWMDELEPRSDLR